MAQKKMNYEEAVKRLEQLISQIESNEQDMDSLAEKLKEARDLIAFCKLKLTKADEEVEKILNEERFSEE